jgi:hypothetical protein
VYSRYWAERQDQLGDLVAYPVPHETVSVVMRKETCSKCGSPRDRPDQRYCRACHAAYVRAHGKPRTDENRRKDRCRSYARAYLKRGKLERKSCERCGSSTAQMHHADHSKPLEVTWLCRECDLALRAPAPPLRFSRRRTPWRPPSRQKSPESEPYIPRGAIKRAQARGETFIETKGGIIVSGAFVRVT